VFNIQVCHSPVHGHPHLHLTAQFLT
jgi:hypothetical protein